jgi:hypothetical protein
MSVGSVKALIGSSRHADVTSYDGRTGEGIVNLPRVRRQEVRSEEWSESSRRILGDFGEFAPCNEPGCELFAIE